MIFYFWSISLNAPISMYCFTFCDLICFLLSSDILCSFVPPAVFFFYLKTVSLFPVSLCSFIVTWLSLSIQHLLGCDSLFWCQQSSCYRHFYPLCPTFMGPVSCFQLVFHFSDLSTVSLFCLWIFTWLFSYHNPFVCKSLVLFPVIVRYPRVSAFPSRCSVSIETLYLHEPRRRSIVTRCCVMHVLGHIHNNEPLTKRMPNCAQIGRLRRTAFRMAPIEPNLTFL